MVNYCCVAGCGRNSRRYKHLNYYCLPKERHRQVQWLKAAGREDLLVKDQDKLTHRVCSRHFPHSSIKNRYLCPDAVPSLCLPGSFWVEDGVSSEPLTHQQVFCNSCRSPIQGFCYKCVTCKDYDLCTRCEMREAHSQHYMLRIPKPLKFKVAKNLIDKLRNFLKTQRVSSDTDTDVELKTENDSDSSDNEPVIKYIRSYDSGIDLSEDIKNKLRNEVIRALKSDSNVGDNYRNKVTALSHKATDRKRAGEDISKSDKKTRMEDNTMKEGNIDDSTVENAPEVAFADVNMERWTLPVVQDHQPVMHVKLSEDLTELIIEVPPETS